ncbi:MAG: methyltransferase domain-containing protein [Deltaproteobacteria bacterium]|nr:methyltransferase domain-containing protein [Deltaproteobacteria bacterium]
MNATNEHRGRTEEERDYYALSKRVYAIFAHVYDAVVLPFRKLRREVANMVALGPGSRLLDVATGTGAQAFAFAAKAREVVGIDLSVAMLRVARRKNRFPNVTFQQADAADLPFEDGSFDASCVSFALHEMPSSVRERVLREMERVTKPGGSVTVVDYALPRNRVASSLVYHLIKLYERDHYATFVNSDVPALLKSAGIELSQERPALAGVARILTGHRSEAVSRARPDQHEPDAVASLGRSAPGAAGGRT